MKQRSTDATAVADAGAGASVWSRRAMRYGLPALAAAALTTVGPDPASAGGGGPPPPPPPEENHVWGGCELSAEAVNEIRQNIFDSAGGEGGPFGDFADSLEVAFVVVYSLQENDGQPLTTEGHTGPILCVGGTVGEGISHLGIETTTDTTQIPDPTSNAGSGDAVSVDILDLEEALALRYLPLFDDGEGGLFEGIPEKRYCHTVDDNNDCFTVFPTVD